ncbi:ASCH domain-containing protein [Ruania alkalisoli]|uniref:ASCH domain-containing protein n=1 Tax=Ruania alkalisoli TaxID=2779775 RepID=A0A7M1SS24_9MICO|nr:ASCH domain-containing protein [Ruania alkalisoli]QOR69572.1 ASCH domain-containing protein [Ruania alkalisoli]
MDSDEIEQFWKRARLRGRVAWLEPFVGQHRLGTLPPPAFAFAPEPYLAQRMAEEVLAGERTAVSTLRSDIPDDVPVPEVGDLAIVLDGHEQPVALIRTVEVRVVAFGEVDDRHARGECVQDAASWREHQRQLMGATDADDVVLERIVLVFPAQESAPVAATI